MTLKKAAAITGIAEMPSIKKPEGHTAIGLASQMVLKAVADAGLEKLDIDGMVSVTPISAPGLLWPSTICESLGMGLSYIDTVNLGGASAAGAIWRAAAAIKAGMCNHVVCVVSDVMTSAAMSDVVKLVPASEFEFEMPYGNIPPLAGYGMIANRHIHEFGTTAEQLAKVAVDQRINGNHTPGALFREKPLTLEGVLSSPLINGPIHMPEAVAPCTGASAVVVSRVDALSNCPNKPVYLLGAGEAGAHISITRAPSLTNSWVQRSAGNAFGMAGVSRDDIDFVQVYDCFTITVLLTLEDLGFCVKGEGGRFIEQNDLTWSGDFPCNTNGGQLAYGQAGMAGGMTHVVEAVRQLMGRAGERQVKNAEIGVAHGNGGIMGEQVTLILGLE